MESDDDFLPATQFSTQYRSKNRQSVTSTSRPLAQDMPGPSHSGGQGASRSGGQGASQPQASQLSQIQDGLKFLMERVQQLSGDSRGIKRPAEQKPYDKEPDTKEQCHLCKKLYANKTTLFRHYRAMHQEMNPEKYHGCSVNSTVVSLDVSFRENTCGICGYAAASQNALDAHNITVHSNVVNANSNNDANIAAHGNASASSNNRTDVIVAGASGKENVSNHSNIMDKLHKCEECACYFEERNKLDEHMKVQHGCEVVCKICNRNLLYKDIDGHVKDRHPDVYKKNKEKIEKVIFEKVMKNKKGKRVHVFICTKCDLKMIDKMEAERHARGHKKGLKIKVAPRNKVSKAKDDFTDVATNNVLIILTCDDCDTSTGSYDVAVEHAQYHVTNNSNDRQFVTQVCLICELKFEPLCYKKHIDLHYNNKEIHKESFKYFKYRFQLLLSGNWFDCFNTDEPVFKEMMSRSIYEHTRSVKMRVMHEGVYKLYKCCQCDNFVEPTAVLNHTMNYDTCVKVKCSYACNICQRKFNNRLARNNHAKDHKSEENYKIVLFNHVNDKEFNKILNDPNRSVDNGELRNYEEVLDNNSANAPKVLYKCLCGLCFVRKENVDVHAKICPGRDPKKSCPKCNNFFNAEELLTHCFEHHLNETRIVIENICPDAVVVDSDEEPENKGDDNRDIIEIDSSDEDDLQTERFNTIKIEVLKADATTVRGSSEDEAERQTMNVSEIAVSEAGENIVHVASEQTLIIEKSEKDNTDEDEDRCNNDLGIDNEMTDDDSQDTISYENTETVIDVAIPAANMNEHDKLKCVPMNLLLNPLHFENGFLNKGNIDVLNAEISTDIETVRQQLNTAANEICGPFNDTAIKQEKSWLFDPTDFSNIRSRRSLRQMQMEPVSSNSRDIVDLLTDDEETEMNHDNEYTEISDNVRSDENNGILNEEIGNNMRENTSNNIYNTSVTQQTPNGGNVVEMLNDISHTTDNVEDIQIQHTQIIHIEVNAIKESVAENNVVCENAQTELTNKNGQRVATNTNISNSSHFSFEDAENNEITTQDFRDDDDDLFIPSGIGNHNTELNNNEKEMEKDNRRNSVERIVAQVDSANTTHSSSIAESESVRFEDIPVDTSTCVENLQQGTETNGNNESHENNDIVNIDRNQIQINNEVNTQDFVESTPNETSTNSIFTDIPERETTLKELPKEVDTNIRKEFDFLNINIKRELIDENVQENVNDCDREVVRIKTEPNYVESEYNCNKENDIFIINKTDNVNYKNCSIC